MVAVERIDRLRSLQSDRRIERIPAGLIIGRQRMVVDRDRMVADDELHCAVCGRDYLPHAFAPDRAVHRLDFLHLHHQLVLRQARVLRPEPVQALGRPQFLDVDEAEQRLEVLMPFTHVFAYERPYGWRAIGVDRAQQALLDLVADESAEHHRVEILLHEAPLRRGPEVRPAGPGRAVWQRMHLRLQVAIRQLARASLKEAALIPDRQIVVVSRDRHCCCVAAPPFIAECFEPGLTDQKHRSLRPFLMCSLS